MMKSLGGRPILPSVQAEDLIKANVSVVKVGVVMNYGPSGHFTVQLDPLVF